ncbi:hypothetical protein NDR89_23080 [Cupriavidus gilardii]|uniref:DNA pilot protein n=1 Tax=Cupriavidus gilardii TaxID=82541 RepID=A0ABY4VQN4_9BURK|nr:hypothetical protein [Cupriavidus gilardii]USE79477.1 hypothetical protein NDR89_23080 [Cupriavidus gilardii]
MAGLDFLLGAQGGDADAARMGLLSAGLGILANNTGHYGAAMPALAAGGLAGIQGYRNAKDNALVERYRAAQIGQMEQAMAKQQALQSLLADRFGRNQQSPSQSGAVATPVAGGTTPTATAIPAQGGGFPLSLNDVSMLKAMGGPDLFDQYKYATDGVKRDAGAYYQNPITGETRYYTRLADGQTMGPNGQVSTAPGYAQSVGQIEGARAQAQEAAKAGLDLVAVPDGRGGSVMMPRAQAAAVLGGGQAGGFGTTPSQVVTDAATSINDNFLKNSYQPVVDAGRSASDMQANISALRAIPLETGWGTEAVASAANVLTSLGIAPKSAEALAANAQKFQSVAMDRLMTTLMAQKGPQTEGDAQRASQTFAKLSNRPEANQFILDLAQAKANQDQRRAAFYEQALPLAQKSGDLQRIDREWQKIRGSIWNDPALQRWSPK